MGSFKETSFCHCHPSSAHPSASASDVSEVRSPLVVVVVILQIGRLRRHRAPVLRDGTLLAAQSEKIKASTSARLRFLFLPRRSLFFTSFFPALLFLFFTPPPHLPPSPSSIKTTWMAGLLFKPDCPLPEALDVSRAVLASSHGVLHHGSLRTVCAVTSPRFVSG